MVLVELGFELDVSKFGDTAVQNEPWYPNSNFLGPEFMAHTISHTKFYSFRTDNSDGL